MEGVGEGVWRLFLRRKQPDTLVRHPKNMWSPDTAQSIQYILFKVLWHQNWNK